jgi:2-aminoethylphosphonate-pyruvate transaminase
MSENILLTPGPVMVSEAVLSEFSKSLIFHRYDEFESLFKDTCHQFLKLLNADPDRFSAVIYTGSGTLANESVLSSAFSANDKVLVISNGDFGERLAHVLTTHKIPIAHLKLDWFTPIDLQQVMERFKAEQATAIAMVAMETSTGMLNPVRELSALLKASGQEAQVFVDAVSAIGYEEIDLQNINYMTTVLNKGLEGPPGLSLACVDRLSLKPNSAPDSVYLNLHRYLDFGQRHQTPTTPSIPHIRALKVALEQLNHETVAGRKLRYANLTKVLIDRLKPLGFTPLIEDSHLRSCSMVCFRVPSAINVDELKQYLYQRGVVVWFPKHAPDTAKSVIIAVMGNVTLDHIDRVTEMITTFASSAMARV